MMERIVEKLNARFELAEHEVRTGGSGKWFVYLKKDAIIRRLDSVVPMGWGSKIISSLRTNDRVEVVMEMTIKDITRSYDGVAEDNRRKGKEGKPDTLFPLNTAKAASTDAFKRVASMFGVGLYLQSCGTIKASSEQAALKAFEQWYNRGTGQPHKEIAESLWPSRDTVNWVMDKFREQELSDKEILKLAGVKALDDGGGWRRYTGPNAAVTAMSAELDHLVNEDAPHYDNGYVDTFHFMSYAGKRGNLQFSTFEPETGNDEHNTIAVCYGGRGVITKWGGKELNEQLDLAQYDKIKGKNITSRFIKMVVPIEFYFEDDQSNSDFDFKVTGIKGDPVIPH